MKVDQSSMLAKMRDILGEKFVVLTPVSYALQENFQSESAHISCELSRSPDDERLVVKGEATGLVDAFFVAIKAKLAQDYPSLNSIRFSDFKVTGMMSTCNAAAGSDAEALVELTVLSSEDVEFTFSATSRSVSRASIDATLQAVGYFVNSEQCFIEIHHYLEHYRSERRADLVTKYQLLLAEMVRNTSYTEVIDKIAANEFKR